MTDRELIGQYVDAASQQAFGELVRRHAGWVYGCARRRVRDAHSAEDVTQAVFILLSQNARKLAGNERLAPWLFKATHYCSANALKQQARRQKYEREAAMQQQLATAGEPANWEEIWPILDEAVRKLRSADREAVLLRFYQGMSVSELAGTLGIGEAAAKKRVQRAVEKLRELLAKKGVMPGVGALRVAMAEKLTEAAPAGLVEATTAAAGCDATGSAGVIAKGAIKMMAWAKVKLAAGVLLGLGLAGIAGFEVLAAGLAMPAAPTTEPAGHVNSQGAPAGGPSTASENSFLDAHSILEGWLKTYGGLRSVRVSYEERIVSAPPNDDHKPYPWCHTDRVEQGSLYRIRQALSNDPDGRNPIFLEHAFDGDVSGAYFAATATGSIDQGLMGWDVETENQLTTYLLMSPFGSARPEQPDSRQFAVLLSPTAGGREPAVRPKLEKVAGEACHVVEIGGAGSADQKTGVVVWVAHERAMMPMKYQRFVGGQLITEVEVREAGKAEPGGEPLYYPKRARRLVVRPTGPTEYELLTQAFEPNPHLEKKDFRVVFPVGTRVTDHVARVQYLVGKSGPEQVIAFGGATQPSGPGWKAEKPIDEKEFAHAAPLPVTQADTVGREAPGASTPEPASSHRYPVLAMAIVGAGIVGVALIYGYKRRKG